MCGMDAKLIVIGGKTSKESVALKLPTVIGRGRKVGLTVAHPMISRRHCELFEADGLLMVRDLGSLNGTVIDGRRIKESPLPPEGEFAVGPLTFRAQYEYEGDLNALPDAVLADPVAPQPEQQESWSDSPDPEPAGKAVSFDPMTEAVSPVDEAEVELSFSEDLQGEQPAAVEEKQPTIQEKEREKEPPPAPLPPAPSPPPPSPPAPPKKPAVPKKKTKGYTSMLQGALKKKGGKAAKQLGKAPVDQPPTEKEPADASEAKKPDDAPKPESEPAPPKKPAVDPADEEFDVDAFLDGAK